MSAARPEISILPDRAALALAAARHFADMARDAISRRGRFSVALSGGTTPRDLYLQLAAPEFRDQIDWSRTDLFFGDERSVPPGDPQSNSRMADEALISRVPVPPANVHRIPAEKPPVQAADDYDRLLREYGGGTTPRLDLVLLGLGANAHTASLFPHTAALHENERLCVAVWVQELKTYRITLTVPVLNAGRCDEFLVAGPDKAAAVREVLRGPYKPDEFPAQLIQPADGELLWLLDRDAAKELE